MKKKAHQKVQKQDDSMTLSNILNKDLVNQLKNKQRELMKEEQEQKEALEQQKREERRRAEKNKTFAELLSEDNKDWRNFK
ncbi:MULTISPECIES: YqkE family protein [Bacillus]|uniref:YqkE family protein n=1 Tax=Bacillus TaxID=1386 RepID=UPI00031CF1ED|nr:MULTISPECIES: YqkE family protein [Bacillus]